jgi:hypothetical protein
VAEIPLAIEAINFHANMQDELGAMLNTVD